MATLKSEIREMKVGATKVCRMKDNSRAYVSNVCSLLKQETGQVYHTTCDWKNRLVIVKREK